MALRTLRQRETSKLNGALGRGPTSVEGKKRSSLNSTTHGIFAKQVLPKGEGADDERQSIDALRSSLQPTTLAEEALVHELGEALHRSGRLGKYMAAAKKMGIDDAADCDVELKAILRGWRQLLVRWELLDDQIGRSGLGSESLEALEDLLQETCDVEIDPHDGDSALRQLPLVKRVRRMLASRFPPDQEDKDRLIGVIRMQRKQLTQMVGSMEERIRLRESLRKEMGKAMPDERSLRLAARYDAYLSKRAAAQINLLVELRRAATNGIYMEFGE
jgi:hypothetical protein